MGDDMTHGIGAGVTAPGVEVNGSLPKCGGHQIYYHCLCSRERNGRKTYELY